MEERVAKPPLEPKEAAARAADDSDAERDTGEEEDDAWGIDVKTGCKDDPGRDRAVEESCDDG